MFDREIAGQGRYGKRPLGPIWALSRRFRYPNVSRWFRDERPRMIESKRYRTLFVCIGNSCRSPMAEAIANARHADVIDAFSAGLGPAPIVQALTFSCLRENNIELDPAKKPQHLAKADWARADLIVNMSGHGVLSVIPDYKGDILIWDVPDPIGQPIAVYRIARDLIDRQVDALAEALRKGGRLPGL